MKIYWIALPAALMACSAKKKDPVPPVYEAPTIEWPEDEDLDDLPEAGEEDTGQ